MTLCIGLQWTVTVAGPRAAAGPGALPGPPGETGLDRDPGRADPTVTVGPDGNASDKDGVTCTPLGSGDSMTFKLLDKLPVTE